MHKKIAKIIWKMVNESPYKSNMKCTIVPDRDGAEGFWSVQIEFKRMDDAHTNALLEAIPLIGLVYGEGIMMPERSDVMIIS